jgi:TalC/MipB family fructose-6-phosphate aldolase
MNIRKFQEEKTMKLIIDDANVEKVKKVWELYPCDGVTTNPSILAKGGRKPYEVLTELRDIVGPDGELHVQVVSKDAEGMLEEAKVIREKLGANTFVKIPTTPQGLKAMKALSAQQVNITATAIYTPMQAFLAAKAGAKYAAPYINRIDNFGYDGVQVARDIQDIFDNNELDCNVLAASFKNSQQVLELTKYGIGAATIGTDVIEGLIKNKAIDAAIEVFNEDFATIAGEGKTMADC